MTATERCEFTDLPAGTCADSCCRPELAEVVRLRALVPLVVEGTWREAAFPSPCACGCGVRIQTGDDIVLAETDPEGKDAGWCLVEHTRSTPCH